MLFQKLGSRIEDKISPVLQIKGTYQILFGFCLTIKKQPATIIKSLIIWLINPVSVCGVIIESEMIKTISPTIKTNNANTALGVVAKNDLIPLVFIVMIAATMSQNTIMNIKIETKSMFFCPKNEKAKTENTRPKRNRKIPKELYTPFFT